MDNYLDSPLSMRQHRINEQMFLESLNTFIHIQSAVRSKSGSFFSPVDNYFLEMFLRVRSEAVKGILFLF